MNDGVLLEGDRRAKQCHMVGAIPFKDMFNHPVAFLPREVEVEVGRTASFWVEETLEVEVQLYRIHIGDLETVGHHAIGAATSAHMIEALLHGKVDNVPGNEKISAKAHFFYNFQLFLNASISRLVGLSIAVNHPVESQLAQQFTVVIHVARESAFVFRTAVKIDLAVVQDTLSVLNELRIERVGRFHPFLWQ